MAKRRKTARVVACSRCHKQKASSGRYCRDCRREYMRAWRKLHITVPRKEWERLTQGERSA